MQRLRPHLKRILHRVFTASLEKASREQGLEQLRERLKAIVPDITGQYTTFQVDTPYLTANVRCLHAFQVSLVDKVIGEYESPVIVDIGDSAGTHLQYLFGLHAGAKKINCLSINSDPTAVKNIRAKGMAAICARAEDLQEQEVAADVFLCFETLEHLTDPSRFLYELSSRTKVRYLIVTVPYVSKSRVGLHHIRKESGQHVSAENTHLFELNPEDWKLLLRHSGWQVVDEKIYLQYPRRSFLRLTKPLWKRLDFEGFYGMILTRDQTWSSRYADW